MRRGATLFVTFEPAPNSLYKRVVAVSTPVVMVLKRTIDTNDTDRTRSLVLIDRRSEEPEERSAIVNPRRGLGTDGQQCSRSYRSAPARFRCLHYARSLAHINRTRASACKKCAE